MQPFEHQTAALSEIVDRARAFYAAEWRELPIKPRWHSLVVAPTGAGKSARATMARAAIGGDGGGEVTLLRISVPGWIPGGSTGRTVAETIGTIAEAVALNHRTLLVLDELDKATTGGGLGSSGTSSS